jgi:protein-disulfide isomerase
MKNVQFALLLSAITSGLLACTDPGSIEQIKNDMAVLKHQQTTLLDKINAIEASLKARPNPAQQPQQPQPPLPQGPFTVPAKDAPVLGNATAPTFIVAWSDFQCPFCSKVVPIINDTLKDPEVSGKVAFVFKQFPLSFHQQAMPAAKAALAAGRQDKFFEMHDKIFANQQQINDQNLEIWAKEIGLNIAKFKKDLADPALEAQIRSDIDEGTKAGVRGTPSIYIGTKQGDNYVIDRAQGRTVDAFKQSIKALLEKKPA